MDVMNGDIQLFLDAHKFGTLLVFAIVPTVAMPEPEERSNIHFEKEYSAPHLSYVVVNQPVKELLAVIARDSGIRIAVSESIRGRISSANLEGDVYTIVDDISQMHSLDWFEFNGVIHISDNAESSTRIIRLGDLKVEDALAELEENGLMLDRFPIRSTSENSAISITGSPYLIALAESIIEGIPSEVLKPRPAARTTVLVRRGMEVEYVQFTQ